MELFTEDYDPGFLNVPGFGQSVTNPLAPVYYEALGIVKDLSVYNSIYATKTINAGVSFIVGKSTVSASLATFGVPSTFAEDVSLKKSISVAQTLSTGKLVVNGRQFKPTRIRADNGTFTVLAAA